MDEFTKGLTHPVVQLYLKGRFLAMVIFVAIAVLLALPAIAAPKAQSAAECRYLADAGITAQALAKQGLSPDVQRQIMERIYLPENALAGANPDLVKHLRQMISAVLNSSKVYVKMEDGAYAEQIFKTCAEKDGDLDSVLGVAL